MLRSIPKLWTYNCKSTMRDYPYLLFKIDKLLELANTNGKSI